MKNSAKQAFGSVVPPSGDYEPDMEKIKRVKNKYPEAAIVVFCVACGSTYAIKSELLDMTVEALNLSLPESLSGKFLQVSPCMVCAMAPFEKAQFVDIT